MKKIKLLKDWTDPNGQKWTAGTVLEISDANLVAQLVNDKIAEEVMAESSKPTISAVAPEKSVDVEAIVTKAVDSAIKASAKITSVKDLSDEDPGFGYLPQRVNNKWSREEKLMAFGNFAHDVYVAGKGKTPERLAKCYERSARLVQKGIKSGLVSKAAGDGLQYGEDADVGYMIPSEINMMLLDVVDEQSIIRPRATTLTLGAGGVNLPKVKDYDRSSGLLYGGVLAYFKGEDAQLTETKPQMENIHLELHQLTALAYSSKQAMTFSPIELGQYILPKLAAAIVWKEEYAFTIGAGAGMPLGLINSGCAVSITAESGQTSSANVIVTKNIDNMIARIKVDNMNSLVWLYNRPDLYVWLMNLVRTVGTGGETARLFSGGIANATLSGIPIFDSQHCPAAATAGDLILTDLSQYIIADHRSGAEVAQSMHLKFDYGQEAFRIIKFVDGKPMNSAAFTRQKSTNTTSSIMMVATRT